MPVTEFLLDSPERILGILAANHHHALEEPQRWAWLQTISILKKSLADGLFGQLLLEFYIPRMGKRADAVLVTKTIVFVIEFKIGAGEHESAALVQVEDYALDLKNFHEGSHHVPIVPILVSTHANSGPHQKLSFADDLVAQPVRTNADSLGSLVKDVCAEHPFSAFDIDEWMSAGYKPTPTIVEAAEALYKAHTVADISRQDARNLQETSDCVNRIIDTACQGQTKAICFVTGVPGSGKTLAGLNIATARKDGHRDEHAVFLSGNGPLVEVLREALIRDTAKREGNSKKSVERSVHKFIQNVHHFRDHYVGCDEIPAEKVVVFDEAQRAWTLKKTAEFMHRKRGQINFAMSEPEFLISVMDRRLDWCAIVCLVGSGQEINTGEAGIVEWLSALQARFPHWQIYISPHTLLDSASQDTAHELLASPRVHTEESLHLAVSIRSFRAESLSEWVGHVINNAPELAKEAYKKIEAQYPIYLSRNLRAARAWLHRTARGSERFGLVASSGAQRLRPEGIYVKGRLEAANWFLNPSTDVRSSYYLEDVANEFLVQGLELDWVGVCWDGDFHHNGEEWILQSFEGTEWQRVKDESRRLYLKNAYRVILTRARQGMVVFVPTGNIQDRTRPPSFYDGTFDFLRSCGLPVLED